MKKIGIIGAGSWGTALAMLLCRNKHKVTVWSWDAALIQVIKNTHHNEAFIHDARLDDKITFTDSLEFLPQCEIVVLSVPSHAIGEVCARIRPYVNSAAIIVNTAKGFENESLRRLSEVIKDSFPYNPIVVLSGPSHAEEVAKNLPTFIVAAGESLPLFVVPMGIWHNMEALQSGTVIFEAKDGMYAPLLPEDVL